MSSQYWATALVNVAPNTFFANAIWFGNGSGKFSWNNVIVVSRIQQRTGPNGRCIDTSQQY